MLKSSLRLLVTCVPRSTLMPRISQAGLINYRPTALFCKTEKHQSNTHGQHERHHHQRKSDEREAKHEEKPQSAEQQESHEEKHQVHEKHHAKEHGEHQKHGDGKHGHDHHAAHHTKMSKMTFEELVEIKTEESMKYAHHIYERESKKLREMKEEKQNLQKSRHFFDKLEVEIKEKQEKLAENISLYEQEAELSRKRAEKQIEESKSFAVTKLAKQLLDVADCIANCKRYADQSQNKDIYIEEVVQSQQLLRGVLKRFEIEQFDPVNEEYDPNLQESLLEVPTPPGYKANHVAMTMRTGYTIKGRLLRSAQVGIFS